MAISEEDYVREHAALLGRAKLAWTDCHDAVFLIFHDLSGMTWEKSTDVFFSLKADRAQREATVKLLKEVLPSDNDQGMSQKGKDLLDKLDVLADERDSATHTMWAVMMPQREITPHPLMPRHPHLKDDFKAQFENLTIELGKLLRELFKFDAALRVHMESIAERAARTADLKIV